jgi:microcystin degradation protein MlrC
MTQQASALVAYKTYPHVDMYETGERVGRITLRALKGLSKPIMVWGNRPMLPHIMRMGTAEAPMRDLVDAARGFEEDGALAVSVFGGFPHADIHDAGISVVTVTEDDRESAETICNGLLDVAWNRREEFVYHAEPLANSKVEAVVPSTHSHSPVARDTLTMLLKFRSPR